MEEIYVVGVGMTPFGRLLDKDIKTLTGAAVQAALDDAGLRKEDLQGAFFGNASQGHMDGQQMIRGQIALREAESYPGPSLVLAYSQCIAHGIDMRFGMKQAARAVASGHWPLFRFDPRMRKAGLNPFRLDSTRPRITVEDYAYRELRYSGLKRENPDAAAEMLAQAQAVVDERHRLYEDMAARDGARFLPHRADARA